MVATQERWNRAYLKALGLIPTRKTEEVDEVEEPLALMIAECGHEVRRQVVVPGGRVDIYNDTIHELIECKASGDCASIGAAVDQLQRYRWFFPGPRLAIAVPHVHRNAEWMREPLYAQGIRIIELRPLRRGV